MPEWELPSCRYAGGMWGQNCWKTPRFPSWWEAEQSLHLLMWFPTEWFLLPQTNILRKPAPRWCSFPSKFLKLFLVPTVTMKTGNLNSVRRGTYATQDSEELLCLGHVVYPNSAGPHLAVRLFYSWKKKNLDWKRHIKAYPRSSN